MFVANSVKVLTPKLRQTVVPKCKSYIIVFYFYIFFLLLLYHYII